MGYGQKLSVGLAVLFLFVELPTQTRCPSIQILVVMQRPELCLRVKAA